MYFAHLHLISQDAVQILHLTMPTKEVSPQRVPSIVQMRCSRNGPNALKMIEVRSYKACLGGFQTSPLQPGRIHQGDSVMRPCYHCNGTLVK